MWSEKAFNYFISKFNLNGFSELFTTYNIIHFTYISFIKKSLLITVSQ